MKVKDLKLIIAIGALEKIKREEGKVCTTFEFCNHESCNSSTGSWQIADKALSVIKKMGDKS